MDKHIILFGVGMSYRKNNFGVHCLNAFEARFKQVDQIRLLRSLDRETTPSILQSGTHFLIFDMIDAGFAPGALVVFKDEALLTYLQVNSHFDWGLQDILSPNKEPVPLQHMALIGIQTDNPGPDGHDDKIAGVLHQAEQVLSAWGVRLQDAFQ